MPLQGGSKSSTNMLFVHVTHHESPCFHREVLRALQSNVLHSMHLAHAMLKGHFGGYDHRVGHFVNLVLDNGVALCLQSFD